MDYTAALKEIPLFHSLNEEDIDQIRRHGRLVELPAGQVLFSEGDPGLSFYIILSGQLEIIKALGTAEERLLATSTKGSFLGEMSMFDRKGLRVAAVRASQPSRLLEISHASFDRLLHRQPDLAYEVMRELSLRLRDTDNAVIHDLQEKNRQLARAYADLQAAQAQLIEKERLERELQVARQIQESILPHTLPVHPDFGLGARMVPARTVGGDLYDLIEIDDHRLGLMIGDVSDKGVPAAIFMALTRSLVRAESIRHDSVVGLLKQVNHHLLDMNEAGLFVTAIYGILDTRLRTFTYARAGHEYPLVLSPEGASLDAVRIRGQALGVFADIDLEQVVLPVPPGTRILLFTDGAPDSLDARGRTYDRDRLLQALTENRNLKAQALCDTLLARIQAFRSDTPQTDDIAFVAICA